MTLKSLRTGLLLALFLVSLGGVLLHYRIHTLDKPANIIPFLCGLISMTVVMVMFFYKKTAAYGHFGRDEPEFSWEAADKAQILKSAS